MNLSFQLTDFCLNEVSRQFSKYDRMLNHKDTYASINASIQGILLDYSYLRPCIKPTH